MRRLLVIAMLLCAGCGQPQALPKDVVARVNNYMITADEFRRALDAAPAGFRNYPGLTPAMVKEKVLDEMIANQLLLEEAQKLNFDKQSEFLAEVEGYWRQALLKAVIQKRNKQIMDAAGITDAKLRELYDRSGVQLELTSVFVADEAAARELSSAGEDFEEAVKKLGARLVRQDTGWWLSGDLSWGMEDAVWPLKVGGVSRPFFTPEDGWSVVKVMAKEPLPQKPFAEMRGALRKRFTAQAVQGLMDRWIAGLRAKAIVVRDQSAIDRVDLGQTQEGGRDGR